MAASPRSPLQRLRQPGFLLAPRSTHAALDFLEAPPLTKRQPQKLRLGALLRRRGGAVAGKGAGVDGLTLLSTAMGYVIIAGSMLFKVPQAVRIFRKQSAEGLSASMYVLETAGIAMSLAFSMRNAFPFSTYGEAVFILLQNMAIMAGACHLRGEARRRLDRLSGFIPRPPTHANRHLGLQRHAPAPRARPLPRARRGASVLPAAPGQRHHDSPP